MNACQFQDVCSSYEKACDVRLLLKCPHYHNFQLSLFTKVFQETFLCRLAKPTIYEKRLYSGTPIYAYTHQALYNAIVSEFRFVSKYSYLFIPIANLVTRAMDGVGDHVLESVVIAMSEYRTVSDSFVTPLVEATVWSARHKPTFILLPAGFTQVPPNWKRAL